MASKGVTDRQKSSESVVATATTNASLIADNITPALKRGLNKGQPMPDVTALVLGLADMLSSACGSMVAADEAHGKELSDDEAPRTARDETAAELSDYLVQTREIATGLFGGNQVKAIGFTMTVPRDPVVLNRYAGEVASSMRNHAMPAPRVRGAHWSPTDIADEIDALRSKLDAALKAVARETREAQTTLEAKNRAVEQYDMCFTGVATTLVGLLTLANKAELAAKVRPSSRRPGQTIEAAEPQNPAPTPTQ